MRCDNALMLRLCEMRLKQVDKLSMHDDCQLITYVMRKGKCNQVRYLVDILLGG